MGQQTQVGRVATWIRTTDAGFTQIIYHQTAVVSFDAKEIVLNSGGWRTPTTKTRMNQASNQFGLGYHVFQRDWDWYVIYPHGLSNLQEGKEIPFEDGMVLSR